MPLKWAFDDNCHKYCMPSANYFLISPPVKKTFMLILAFLVLGFTVLPCADSLCFSNNSEIAYEITESDCPDEEHQDNCSPFCICTCCPGVSLSHTSDTANNIPFPEATKHFFLIDIRTYSFALPVWQPPQLV